MMAPKLEKVDEAICLIDVGYKPPRGKQPEVRRVCRAGLIYPRGVWDIADYEKPKEFDSSDWDRYTSAVQDYLDLQFGKLVNKYRDGKHGITTEDVGRYKLVDLYCAARRALRDIPRMTIIEDVDIRGCIEWGIWPEILPKIL